MTTSEPSWSLYQATWHWNQVLLCCSNWAFSFCYVPQVCLRWQSSPRPGQSLLKYHNVKLCCCNLLYRCAVQSLLLSSLPLFLLFDHVGGNIRILSLFAELTLGKSWYALILFFLVMLVRWEYFECYFSLYPCWDMLFLHVGICRKEEPLPSPCLSSLAIYWDKQLNTKPAEGF